jgi:hypothetical protein
MFKRLAKSGLVDFQIADFRLGRFRPLQLRHLALRGAGLVDDTHSNDNLPGLRRPKGRRRIPSPALACHWINRNGRLECRWQVEPNGDAAIGDFDEYRTLSRAPRRLSTQRRGRRLALAE